MAKIHRKIYGIQCSFCAETIYKAVSGIDGVRNVYVSMAHEELYIEYDGDKIDEKRIEKVIEELGYRFEEESLEREYREEKRRLFASGVISLYIGLSMVLMWLGYYIPYNQFIVAILGSINYLALGYKYLVMAYHAVRRGILNQHVLMALTGFAGLFGGLIGFIYGADIFPPIEFFGVASFVTTYHLLGGYIGGYVRKKSREAIEKVKKLSPDKATVLRNGLYLEVPVDEVGVDDLVIIKPGERVPVDGVIVEGFSSFDESLVSGESIPVDKSVGDEVISGSLNLENPVVIKVVRGVGERFIDRVVDYIRLSRAAKPNILRLLDKVLKYYVPGVVIAGLISIVAWISIPYLFYGVLNPSKALYILLTVYVMGYPCALGMASPLALVMGGSLAASRGILIRSGDAIEILPKIDYVVLDKTGTLTHGRPKVVDFISYSEDDDVLKAAACIESFSNHPVSKAIIEYVMERLGDIGCGDIDDIEYFKGEGIKGVYNGRTVLIGNRRLLKRYGIETNMDIGRTSGYSLVYIAMEGELKGVFRIEDPIREDAAKTVEKLLDMGYRVSVVSGDDHSVVEHVCRSLGIESFRGGLLPWEKTQYISMLQDMGYHVLMVGDGINDGPSLSKADVGVAMGTGSDIAVDSADIVVVGDRLDSIVYILEMGRKIYSKIRWNLLLAFLFNGVGIPLAALGFLRPLHAMLAMVLSVSTVLLNSVMFRE